MDLPYEEKKDLEKPKPQQATPKTVVPLTALKSCNVELDAFTVVELRKGQEVHGLTRAERDHLKSQGFIG